MLDSEIRYTTRLNTPGTARAKTRTPTAAKAMPAKSADDALDTDESGRPADRRLPHGCEKTSRSSPATMKTTGSTIETSTVATPQPSSPIDPDSPSASESSISGAMVTRATPGSAITKQYTAPSRSASVANPIIGCMISAHRSKIKNWK